VDDVRSKKVYLLSQQAVQDSVFVFEGRFRGAGPFLQAYAGVVLTKPGDHAETIDAVDKLFDEFEAGNLRPTSQEDSHQLSSKRPRTPIRDHGPASRPTEDLASPSGTPATPKRSRQHEPASSPSLPSS